MILVDTSIWIDHLRSADPTLVTLLEGAEVATHSLIVGELAVGSLARREEFLELLNALPRVPVVHTDELLTFITAHQLYAQGLGVVDVHLLASASLVPGTSIWTRDARLRSAAATLGLPSGP
jgi:predicted nucleic acid-binding protein